MMKYISTRGNAPELTFEEVLLTGLAEDGGLYVTKDVPHYTLAEIESWRDLQYAQIAHTVIYPLFRTVPMSVALVRFSGSSTASGAVSGPLASATKSIISSAPSWALHSIT